MEPHILPGSWSLIKKAWAELRLRYVYLFPLLGITFIAQCVSFIVLSKASQPAVTQYGMATVISVFVGVHILVAIVSYLSSIALITLIAKKETETLSLSQMYMNAVRLAIPYAWVSILIALVVLPALVALIIPGLVLAFMLSFAIYAVVIDNDRGVAALTRSWFYAKNNLNVVLWRSAGFLLFMIVTTIIISIVESIVGVAVYGSLSYIQMIGNEQTPMTSSVINSIIQTFILSPIAIFYFLSIYEFLKIKEGPVVDPVQADKIRGWIKILTIVGVVVGLVVLAFALLVLAAAYCRLIGTADFCYRFDLIR